MPSLPTVSGKKAAAAFLSAGFEEKRQCGSHLILKKDGFRNLPSVPLHDTLKAGTLRRLIRDSGLTVEQFTKLL